MLSIGWLLVAVDVVVVAAAAIYISANRRPSSAIAWILVLIFLPVVGIGWYLLVGAQKLPQRRRHQQQQVSAAALERTDHDAIVDGSPHWPPWLASIVLMNRRLGSLPMVTTNSVQVIEGYRDSIEAMAEAIDEAQEYVHVEFFILVGDQTTEAFFAALERARHRGVVVRVLADHVAQLMYPNRRATRKRLAAMGAHYRDMLPIPPRRGWRRPDLRNHRKLVVIDGNRGFTGSQNLIADHYHKRGGIRRGLHWSELMIRIDGPAVDELNAVFVTDWFSETEELLPLESGRHHAPERQAATDAQVVPSGPSFDNENNLKLFVSLISSARSHVGVTSPYYVPDEAIQLAMITAALRGVTVELFVSEVGDQFMVFHAQRSYYEELLRAGVRIHLHAGPTILHAKHLTIDDEVAIVGSSNLDIRSLNLHMELSVLLHDPELVRRLHGVQQGYRSRSRDLTLDRWQQRPRRDRALDSLMRLTSSLQ